MTIAYKVLTADEFAALESGLFRGAPIDQADGYVHLSTGPQLTETVARHFCGQSNLIVAAVDLGALGDAVRWETSRGGELFPHLYGTLPVMAVIAMHDLPLDAAGKHCFPALA